MSPSVVADDDASGEPSGRCSPPSMAGEDTWPASGWGCRIDSHPQVDTSPTIPPKTPTHRVIQRWNLVTQSTGCGDRSWLRRNGPGRTNFALEGKGPATHPLPHGVPPPVVVGGALSLVPVTRVPHGPQKPAGIAAICCAQGQSRTVYTRIFSAGNMRKIVVKIEYSCLSVP